MSQPHILHSALNESITSGRFIDTKFYVFSRRNKSGRVGTPEALFANSRVLTVVPYFESHLPRFAVFSDRFSEGELKNLRDGFPSGEQPYTDSYEYLSDSDLDEEEECTRVDEPTNNDIATNNPFRVSGGASPDQESALAKGYLSQTLDRSSDKVTTCDSGDHLGTVHTRKGKVAIIRDMAATTFKALLCYVYTGEIHFAPFGSEVNRDCRASEKHDWGMGAPPKVSPKSIYRVADKYDIPELKQLAWEKILEDLDNCDLIEEIFSDFAFFFPRVQEIQIKHFAHNLLTFGDTASEDNIKRLQEKLSSLSGVRLERSADALGMLWEELSKSKPVTVEKGSHTSSSRKTLPKISDCVKAALFHSIHTGTFIDCQFFAKNQNGRWDSIRPVYLSSVVAGERFSVILGASRPMADNTDTDSEYETDSDLEDEEVGRFRATEAPPESLNLSTEAESSSPALLLRTGAWRTWRSLFSYLYTGKIIFSPLRSQNVPSNLPLSCSPKSMYSLAKFMSLEGLVVIAYKYIKRRISASNVVTELFSSFAASDDRILDMESDILFNNFENDTMSQEVQEHIRAMACGKAVFQAKTLGFAYHKLLARKRYAIQDPPGCEPQESSETPLEPVGEPEIMLYCARKLRMHAYTVSGLLQDLYCPECNEYGKNGKGEYGRPFTRCAHCNALRDAANQRCRNCSSSFKF